MWFLAGPSDQSRLSVLSSPHIACRLIQPRTFAAFTLHHDFGQDCNSINALRSAKAITVDGESGLSWILAISVFTKAMRFNDRTEPCIQPAVPSWSTIFRQIPNSASTRTGNLGVRYCHRTGYSSPGPARRFASWDFNVT